VGRVSEVRAQFERLSHNLDESLVRNAATSSSAGATASAQQQGVQKALQKKSAANNLNESENLKVSIFQCRNLDIAKNDFN
jgi:hypothetical protein